MADQIEYVDRLRNGYLTVGEPGMRTLLSRPAALELFKQLSKELGFETDFHCCCAVDEADESCEEPTVFEAHGGTDGGDNWTYYICEKHIDGIRERNAKEGEYADAIRDMREIPKETT